MTFLGICSLVKSQFAAYMGLSILVSLLTLDSGLVGGGFVRTHTREPAGQFRFCPKLKSDSWKWIAPMGQLPHGLWGRPPARPPSCLPDPRPHVLHGPMGPTEPFRDIYIYIYYMYVYVCVYNPIPKRLNPPHRACTVLK